MSYFPGPDGSPWRRVDAAAAGLDAGRLGAAVALAETRETP